MRGDAVGLFDELGDVIEIDEDEPLAKALSPLAKSPGACIVVTKCGRYAGIITDRSIERVTDDPSTIKISAVFEHAPVIESGAAVPAVCAAFFSGSYKALPVREGKRIVGTLGRAAVLRTLLESRLLTGTVSDYMSSPAVTVDAGVSIAGALERMHTSGTRRAVVMRDGKIAGLASAYALKIASLKPKDRAPLIRTKHSSEDASVSEFMVERDELATTQPGFTLAQAAQAMLERGVSSLVVESRGQPVGILSARDVFESVLSTAHVPVYLSGLGREERLMSFDLNAELSRELEKIARSLDVEYLSVHVKRYGHKYSMHARLKTRTGVTSVSNHGFDLIGVAHGLMDELKGLTLGKEKGRALAERNRPRRRGG